MSEMSLAAAIKYFCTTSKRVVCLRFVSINKIYPTGYILCTKYILYVIYYILYYLCIKQQSTYTKEYIPARVEPCGEYSRRVRRIPLHEYPTREARYRTLRHHRILCPLIARNGIHDNKVNLPLGGAANLKHVRVIVRVVLDNNRLGSRQGVRHRVLVTVLYQL